MIPIVAEFTREILDDLYKGMQLVMAQVPDPLINLYALLGRAPKDLIIVSTNTKESATITEVLVDDFNARYLFVWGAYDTGSSYDLDEVMNTLFEIAKKTECTYIEFGSYRAGWERKMKKFNAEVLTQKIYRVGVV